MLANKLSTSNKTQDTRHKNKTLYNLQSTTIYIYNYSLQYKIYNTIYNLQSTISFMVPPPRAERPLHNLQPHYLYNLQPTTPARSTMPFKFKGVTNTITITITNNR